MACLSAAYKSKPFKPRSGIKIAVTDAEATNAAANDDSMATDGDPDESERILGALNVALAKLQIRDLAPLNQIDFEKDDDTNHHVEFVTATSNLRAANYSIEPADRMKVRILRILDVSQSPFHFQERSTYIRYLIVHLYSNSIGVYGIMVYIWIKSIVFC